MSDAKIQTLRCPALPQGSTDQQGLKEAKNLLSGTFHTRSKQSSFLNRALKKPSHNETTSFIQEAICEAFNDIAPLPSISIVRQHAIMERAREENLDALELLPVESVSKTEVFARGIRVHAKGDGLSMDNFILFPDMTYRLVNGFRMRINHSEDGVEVENSIVVCTDTGEELYQDSLLENDILILEKPGEEELQVKLVAASGFSLGAFSQYTAKLVKEILKEVELAEHSVSANLVYKVYYYNFPVDYEISYVKWDLASLKRKIDNCQAYLNQLPIAQRSFIVSLFEEALEKIIDSYISKLQKWHNPWKHGVFKADSGKFWILLDLMKIFEGTDLYLPRAMDKLEGLRKMLEIRLQIYTTVSEQIDFKSSEMNGFFTDLAREEAINLREISQDPKLR